MDALEYDASKEHAAEYINRAHDRETIPAPLQTPVAAAPAEPEA
jgi:hypothetical protein